jgi:hypothetical protein
MVNRRLFWASLITYIALWMAAPPQYAKPNNVLRSGFELSGSPNGPGGANGWGQSTKAIDSTTSFGMLPDGGVFTAYTPNYGGPVTPPASQASFRVGSGWGWCDIISGGVAGFGGTWESYTAFYIDSNKAPLYWRAWAHAVTAFGVTDRWIDFYDIGPTFHNPISLGVNNTGHYTLWVEGVSRGATSGTYDNQSARVATLLKLYTNLIDTTILIVNNTDSVRYVGAITGGTRLYQVNIGWRSNNNGMRLQIDDMDMNDGLGTVENWWPSDSGHILVGFPNQDSLITNWAGRAGGTTNLWRGVSSVPPSALDTVSAGTESDTTGIFEATNTAASGYYFYMQPIDSVYRDIGVKGIPASQQVKWIQMYVRSGEHNGTGTGTGMFQLRTPVNTPQRFTYGHHSGSHDADHNGLFNPSPPPANMPATWGWRTDYSRMLYRPSINRSAPLTGVVFDSTASTKRVEINQIAYMFEYGPADSTTNNKYRVNH